MKKFLIILILISIVLSNCYSKNNTIEKCHNKIDLNKITFELLNNINFSDLKELDSTDKTIHKKILKDRQYYFSDSEIRNLKILFLNDSLVEVSNTVSGLQAPNYYIFNFNTTYQIKQVDLFQYVIVGAVEKTHSLGEESYVHPFRKQNFYNRKDVLPNIVGDTIFLGNRLLIIKDFTFTLGR